jgi:hypothetical protein
MLNGVLSTSKAKDIYIPKKKKKKNERMRESGRESGTSRRVNMHRIERKIRE